MSKSTSNRKKEHIDICINEDVSFRKTNGFEKYEFEHYAITELKYEDIDLTTSFFGKKIDYPFLISCMTGGTAEAEKINERLAISASNLNIPIGVGSQRQALENKTHHDSYKIIRKNAGTVPVLGNIGAAQIAKDDNPVKTFMYLADLVEADAMVVHLNPLQELMQPEGDRDFGGLLKKIEKVAKKFNNPIIVKEVGSGISRKVAKKLIDAGVRGIDVAGAGGTSWAAVELLRRNDINQEDKYFWDWGLPTSYCVKEIRKLKKNHYFTLIASGGINTGAEIAKALALGSDIAASARSVLKAVTMDGEKGVEELIKAFFDTVRKIMYLTNCKNIKELNKVKLLRHEELY